MIAAIVVVLAIVGFFIYKVMNSTETVDGTSGDKGGASTPQKAPPGAGGEMDRFKEMQRNGQAPPMPAGQSAPR